MSGNVIENVQKISGNCHVCPENVPKNDHPKFFHVRNLYIATVQIPDMINSGQILDESAGQIPDMKYHQNFKLDKFWT